MQRQAPEGSGTAAGRSEFASLAQALRSEGVAVYDIEDTPQPPKPDAVYPNNWVSFAQDGTVVLYPMQAESRRRERRQEIIDELAARSGYQVSRLIDLTHHEQSGRYLEGTGSLVLDHVNRVAYACRSPRTHPEVLTEWAHALDYRVVLFDAFDPDGAPYYHTNVLMCIGERFAIAGTQVMPQEDRARLIAELRASGRDVLEIGATQIAGFAGNVLELASWDEALGDCRVVVMSTSARACFTTEDYARLSGATDAVLAVPIPTIERLGGGGVRCMIAEVFLPRT